MKRYMKALLEQSANEKFIGTRLAFEGITTLKDGEDELETPHMEVDVKNELKGHWKHRIGIYIHVYYDDGNESSWGNELWILTPEYAICIQANGRDCFDSGMVDTHFLDRFLEYHPNRDERIVEPKGNYGFNGFHPIFVSHEEFWTAFEQTWTVFEDRAKR